MQIIIVCLEWDLNLEHLDYESLPITSKPRAFYINIFFICYLPIDNYLAKIYGFFPIYVEFYSKIWPYLQVHNLRIRKGLRNRPLGARLRFQKLNQFVRECLWREKSTPKHHRPLFRIKFLPCGQKIKKSIKKKLLPINPLYRRYHLIKSKGSEKNGIHKLQESDKKSEVVKCIQWHPISMLDLPRFEWSVVSWYCTTTKHKKVKLVPGNVSSRFRS